MAANRSACAHREKCWIANTSDELRHRFIISNSCSWLRGRCDAVQIIRCEHEGVGEHKIFGGNTADMRDYYGDAEQLADMSEAERTIAAAQSIEELRASLLAICRVIKYPITESMRETDIILGRQGRAPD